MRKYSIAIAGAGPAGLSAALFLHRDGHEVTIFERFDAPRPLGSGLMLQPTGLAVLTELDLSNDIIALGQRIDRLFGRVLPSRRVVLDVRYRHLHPALFGIAVHRAALFDPLFQAVLREKIRLETNRPIAGLAAGGRPALTIANGRKTAPFDLIVDALGARSPLADGGRAARRDLTYGALWATVPWPSSADAFDAHALEQRYRRASTMVGVLPIGRRRPGGPEETAFFWSIKPTDYGGWRAAGLRAWKTDVERLWPETVSLLDHITDADQLTLARYSHRTLRKPVVGPLVSIGDAAHAASPQLGQGANMALLDARALGIALRDGPDLATALARYAASRRWHTQLYQALSALFTPFYQSDSRLLPPLRDWVAAPATRLPLARAIVAALVAGTILDPRRSLALNVDPIAPALREPV